MSDWWYLLTIALVLAAVAVLALRARRRTRARVEQPGDPARDYGTERETSRLSGMSSEDRAWEAASLERSRRAQPKEQPPRSE